MQPGTPTSPDRKQRIFNLTLAAFVGQVGFLSLIIVLAAVFGGLWLDARFASGRTFTILMVLGSIPISLIIMFWVSRAVIKRIKTEMPSHLNSTEEKGIGKEA